MHDQNTVQRFIELRAQGWSYARLMTELNVTKPTLIAWSRKHQFQIQNLKAIELAALGEKWLAAPTERWRSVAQAFQPAGLRDFPVPCEFAACQRIQ